MPRVSDKSDKDKAARMDVSDPDAPRHRRTYRACLPCRSAKLRCDLGSVDAPSDPPCRRCRRTGRQCEFAESYQRQGCRVARDKSAGLDLGLSSSQPTKLPFISRPSLISPINPPPNPATPRDSLLNHQTRSRFDFVYGRNLETPADALRLLCSVADDNRPSTVNDSRPPQVGHTIGAAADIPSGGDVWIRWAPVREGLLTSTEASTLVQLYARNVNPCHPLVPSQLFQPENLPLLLQEPLLVGAMACVAVRYTDLGQSFDHSEPSRSRVVQARLTDWIIKRISFVTMGSSALRTIGTVEAMLILSEWPPRAMLLEDTAFLAPGEQESRSSANTCKHQDEIAWNLVGLAVRVAQGIGLHDESTYTTKELSSWTSLRRLTTWINCMSADRYVSGRLGRTSLTPTTMSTGWWEMYYFMSMELSDQSFPLSRSRRSWRQSRVVAEHAHEMLYPTPAITADLIKTGRYQSILTRLKPELNHLWSWLVGDLHVNEASDEIEIDDFQELMWRIEHDYVRLYANAIAMRATVMRLLRFRNMRESEARQAGGTSRLPERCMSDMLMSAVEGVQVLEAVESAISLLRHGIECQRIGVLRFCPGRTFQRIMFGSVFLMKAMSVGAVSEKEPEILDLQQKIIECFKEASVDDEHIAAEIANLLGRVFPAFPTVPPQIHLEGPLEVSDGGPSKEQLSVEPAATLLPDIAVTFDQADIFANWGFDPVIILSEMDDFLQAIETGQIETGQV